MIERVLVSYTTSSYTTNTLGEREREAMSRLSKVKPLFVLADILASDDEDDAALEELLKPCPLNLSQCSNDASSPDEQSPPTRQKKKKKKEVTPEELEAKGKCALILLPSLARPGGAVLSHLTRRRP
jgi:hypothetical protein